MWFCGSRGWRAATRGNRSQEGKLVAGWWFQWGYVGRRGWKWEKLHSQAGWGGDFVVVWGQSQGGWRKRWWCPAWAWLSGLKRSLWSSTAAAQRSAWRILHTSVRTHVQAACNPAPFLLLWSPNCSVPFQSLGLSLLCWLCWAFSLQAWSSRDVTAGGSRGEKATGCRNTLGCCHLPQRFIQVFFPLLFPSENILYPLEFV